MWCESVAMLTPNFNLETIRLFLHVTAVTVWVGGQIVMMAILPVLRAANIEGHAASVAKAFQNVAWPAMAVAIFTGFWNILALMNVEKSFGWNMTFGIKFLFVIFSAVGAARHAKAEDPKAKGIYGAIGFGAAIIAMFLGFVL